MTVSRERAQQLSLRCHASGEDMIRLERYAGELGGDNLYDLALWQEQNLFELAVRFNREREHGDVLMAAMEQAIAVAERTVARLKERAGIA